MRYLVTDQRDAAIVANRSNILTTTTLTNSSLQNVSAKPASYHTFSNVFYGWGWFNSPTITTFDPVIRSVNNTSGDQCVGIRMSYIDANNIQISVIRGTLSVSGNITAVNAIQGNYSNTLNITNIWLKIAWYLNTTSSKYTDSMIIINNSVPTLTGLFNETTQNIVMPSSSLLSIGTPSNFKIGTIWAGMNPNITQTMFLSKLMQHSGSSPFFLGKNGEVPLKYSSCSLYVHPTQASLYNSAADSTFTPIGNAVTTLSDDYVRSSENGVYQ